jgi:hypothetical protein
MRGASLQDVKEVLGHADLRTTLRNAHLSPAHLRGAVERLEGLGQGTPAPSPEPAAESPPVGTRMDTWGRMRGVIHAQVLEKAA